MPEENKALKEMVGREVVGKVAAVAELDAAFVKRAVKGLDGLEFKDRIKHLAGRVREALDKDYEVALGRILDGLGPPAGDREAVGVGLEYWVFCQFVEDYGQEDADASIAAMHELTKRFSCEFAIRPFLAKYPAKTMRAVKKWVKDPSSQVRRLCSEGTRPRLPWGMRLNQFIEDPLATRFILDRLVDDESESVRRSVANHLNDISKDHPEVAVEIAKGWLEKPTPEREKAVKHALRTLIKKGDPAVMELYGYGEPKVKVKLSVTPARLTIGETVAMNLTIESTAAEEQKLLVDYIVHFRKANGKLGPKVFKWTEKVLPAGGKVNLKKQQPFKNVSTRKHYKGEHFIEVQVNGQALAKKKVRLEG